MKSYQQLLILISLLSGISLFSIYKPSILSQTDSYKTECAGQVVEKCDYVNNNFYQFTTNNKTYYM